MSEQFDIKMLTDEQKKYDEFITIDVDAQGKAYIVKVFPFFSPIETKELLNQMIAFFKDANETKLVIEDNEFDDLIAYFCMRKFTDIKMTKSKKAKVLYKEFKTCKNSKLFELIAASFAEESTEYLYSQLFKLTEFAAKIETKIKMAQSQIEGLKLNPEVLNKKQIPEV